MKASELRMKSVDELNQELVDLRREQFNLRMQRGAGQLANPAQFGVVKKDIARVKTVLTETLNTNQTSAEPSITVPSTDAVTKKPARKKRARKSTETKS